MNRDHIIADGDTYVRFAEVWIQTKENDMRAGFAELAFLRVVRPDIRVTSPLVVHFVTAVVVTAMRRSVSLSQ